MAPKSVQRFSEQAMPGTERMAPKSVQRFSDRIMRAKKKA